VVCKALYTGFDSRLRLLLSSDQRKSPFRIRADRTTVLATRSCIRSLGAQGIAQGSPWRNRRRPLPGLRRAGAPSAPPAQHAGVPGDHAPLKRRPPNDPSQSSPCSTTGTSTRHEPSDRPSAPSGTTNWSTRCGPKGVACGRSPATWAGACTPSSGSTGPRPGGRAGECGGGPELRDLPDLRVPLQERRKNEFLVLALPPERGRAASRS
jgi:hypothetical protein